MCTTSRPLVESAKMQLELKCIISFIMMIVASNSMSCDDNTDCVIHKNDERNWSKTVINAQNATSLTLNCYNESCATATIYCPTLPQSECNIICHDDKSCRGSVITGYRSTNLNIRSLSHFALNGAFISALEVDQISLYCSASSSCDSTFVHASNAHNINISCSTTPSYSDSCHSLTIYAEFAGTIALHCGDGQLMDVLAAGSCHDSKLYANNANSIDIIAYDLAYGIIRAQNVSVFNLTCISKWFYDGCYHIEISFPNPIYNDLTTFNCFGSCGILDIFDTKCDALHKMNINLNACGISSHISDFITYWAFYLTEGRQIGPQNSIWLSTSHSDGYYCFPWQDQEFINECNCSYIADILLSAFVDDVDAAPQCIGFDTLPPTGYPSTTTTDYPSLSPSGHPSLLPTLSPTLSTSIDIIESTTINKTVDMDDVDGKRTTVIIIIVIAIIIGFIIVFVIVYFLRFGWNKKKHRRVARNSNAGDEHINKSAQNIEINGTQ